MKFLKTFIIAFLLLSTMVFGKTVSNLKGWSETTRIILQWNSLSEDNVSGFEIQRSTDGVSFFKIGLLQSQGHSSAYTYIDDSIIAKVSGRNYYYRIKVKDLDGNDELSEIITVVSNISPVTYSWGSLKALFK